MQIQLDRTLEAPDIISLLESHLTEMRATTPPESVHALDLDALRARSMQFWTARETSGELMGCVALKTHDASPINQGHLDLVIEMKSLSATLNLSIVDCLLCTYISIDYFKGST